jgi:hypothetical protein
MILYYSCDILDMKKGHWSNKDQIPLTSITDDCLPDY